MQVPPGESGVPAVDPTSPSVFVTDVRGQRFGALDVKKLAALDSHASENLGNPKKYALTRKRFASKACPQLPWAGV